MGSYGHLASILAVLLHAVSSINGTENICPLEGALHYKTGKTYKYSYSTEITTNLPGQPEATTFSLQLAAEIAVVAPCSHRLSVILLNVMDENAEFPQDAFIELKTSLEKNTIDFGFYNGKIGELLSTPDETSLSLNLKRGIVSAFQLSAATSTEFAEGSYLEVDIAGECPTTYTVTKTATGEIHLQKIRKLSECTRRTRTIPTFQQESLGSTIRTLLESAPSCNHVIRAGILRSTSCEEHHSLNPFADHSDTVTIHVAQELMFQEEITSLPSTRDYGRTIKGSLCYSEDDRDTEQNLSPVNHLSNFCDLTQDGVRPETPIGFAKLVESLQEVSSCPDFDTLFDQLHRGDLCPALSDSQRAGIIHDVLPAVGSVCSVTLMSRLLQQGAVDFSDVDLWFMSLAMIRDPSRQMIETLLPLTGHADLTRSGYLGISTATRNYCLHSGLACDGTLVSSIEMAILEHLDPTCQSVGSKPASEESIVYLKAIGNLGPSPYAMDVLQLILQRDQKASTVRLAAVEAFRHRDCSDSSKLMGLVTLLKDTNEDVELRVAAYLTLMVCPDDTIIRTALGISAAVEENEQVRQYIRSHLRNLNVSSSPSLSGVRKILSDLPEIISAGTSQLSSSSNYRFESGNKDHIGVLDANVLFADSLLPRMADLDMSVDLFGNKLDLFQLGGRAEGFDDILESVVGPSGPFSGRSLKDSVMSLLYGSDQKRIDRSLLPSRIKKERKEFAYKTEEPNFFAYFRMIGNDVAFFTMADLKKTYGSLVDGYFNYVDFFFGRTAAESYEMSRNAIIHDGSYNIRSVCGLPLSLKLSATASGKISGKTEMNLGGFFSSGNTVKLAGEIAPSFAVRVAATFKVDLGRISTGFSTVSTLHSSVDFSGSFEYKNGAFLKSALNMPKEKIEFLTFSSKSYRIRSNSQELIGRDPAVSLHNGLSECTAPLTSRLFGVELCMELDSQEAVGAKDDVLLPANFRMFLRKTDPGLSAYVFDFENPAPENFRFHFNTPGSNTPRHLELHYRIDHQDRTVAGAIATPWKQFKLSGKLDSLSDFNLHMTEDGRRSYSVVLASEGRMVDDYFNLVPVIQILTPFTDPIDITGSLKWRVDGEIDAAADVTVKSSAVDSRVLLSHKREENSLATGLTVRYRASRSSRSQEVVVNRKVRDFATTTDLMKKTVTVGIEFTEFPDFNTFLQSDTVWSPNNFLDHVDSSLSIYRKNFQDEDNKVLVRFYRKNTQTEDRMKFLSELSIGRGQQPSIYFRLAHAAELDPKGRYFDGRIGMTGFLGEHNFRLAWNNKWITDKSMTTEADLESFSKFLRIRGSLRDRSEYRQNLFPFEVIVASSEFMTLKVDGEVNRLDSQIGLNLDVYENEQKYLTSSHVVTWNPLSFMTQYRIYRYDHSANAHVRLASFKDWGMRTSWTKGSAQWSTVIAVAPYKERGYNLMAIFKKESGLTLTGALDERTYGVDLKYFREPSDIRTALVIHTGVTSQTAQAILQIYRTPSSLHIVHLIDVIISLPESQPFLFVSDAQFIGTSSLNFNTSLTILQNVTTFFPPFTQTKQSLSADNADDLRFTFQLQNEINKTALVDMDVSCRRVLDGSTPMYYLSFLLNGTLVRYSDKLDHLAVGAIFFSQNPGYGIVSSASWRNSDPSQNIRIDLDCWPMGNQELYQLNWETNTMKRTMKFSRSMEKASGNGYAETWKFSHPLFSEPKTYNFRVNFSPVPVLEVDVNNNTYFRIAPKLSGTSAKLEALYKRSSVGDGIRDVTKLESSHEVGGEFVDDNTFVFKALAPGKELLNYRASLERNDHFVQSALWNVDDFFRLTHEIREFSSYAVSELKLTADKLTRHSFNRPTTSSPSEEERPIFAHRRRNYQFQSPNWSRAVRLGGSRHITEEDKKVGDLAGRTSHRDSENILSRRRRNAFAFAGAGSSCGGGAFAGAGAGSQCGGGNSFASMAGAMHNQMGQMMQDMVSKFHSQAQQSGYSGGAINVQIGQSSGGCGGGQQQSSYGGCAPAPSPSQHRIDIRLTGQPHQSYQQPSYQQPAPAPCSSGSGSSCGSPSYPSYQQQPQYQQPSSSYQGAYAGAGVYSTSVDAQPSYGPVDAYQPQQQPYGPSQGAQMHAPQKSSGGPGHQSFQVPVGSGSLTINIRHDSPQQAPQQGSAQYMASGSSQSQYAIAGQIPLGGGAEPRLQYCTPGSTEKGVCLNSEDSLEPTRTKRSLDGADDGFVGMSYVHFVKMTLQNAWISLKTTPELQYVLDMGQRISEHVCQKTWFRTENVKSQLRSFAPHVTKIFRNSSESIIVTQLLPVALTSLRNPLPKTLMDSRFGAVLMPSLASPVLSTSGIATITSARSGNMISTFSGVNYTFIPAPCQYVFAHDFDDGNVTVVLSYASGPVRRSEVHLSEVTVISRLSSFSFQVSSLPFLIGSVNPFPDYTVYRESENQLVVSSKDGWTVYYDATGLEKRLSLKMSALYRGKIAGLAGYFTSNPKKTFISSNRAVVARNELGAFVDAWQAKDRCPAGSVGF